MVEPQRPLFSSTALSRQESDNYRPPPPRSPVTPALLLQPKKSDTLCYCIEEVDPEVFRGVFTQQWLHGRPYGARQPVFFCTTCGPPVIQEALREAERLRSSGAGGARSSSSLLAAPGSPGSPGAAAAGKDGGSKAKASLYKFFKSFSIGSKKNLAAAAGSGTSLSQSPTVNGKSKTTDGGGGGSGGTTPATAAAAANSTTSPFSSKQRTNTNSSSSAGNMNLAAGGGGGGDASSNSGGSELLAAHHSLSLSLHHHHHRSLSAEDEELPVTPRTEDELFLCATCGACYCKSHAGHHSYSRRWPDPEGGTTTATESEGGCSHSDSSPLAGYPHHSMFIGVPSHVSTHPGHVMSETAWGLLFPTFVSAELEGGELDLAAVYGYFRNPAVVLKELLLNPSAGPTTATNNFKHSRVTSSLDTSLRRGGSTAGLSNNSIPRGGSQQHLGGDATTTAPPTSAAHSRTTSRSMDASRRGGGGGGGGRDASSTTTVGLLVAESAPSGRPLLPSRGLSYYPQGPAKWGFLFWCARCSQRPVRLPARLFDDGNSRHRHFRVLGHSLALLSYLCRRGVKIELPERFLAWREAYEAAQHRRQLQCAKQRKDAATAAGGGGAGTSFWEHGSGGGGKGVESYSVGGGGGASSSLTKGKSGSNLRDREDTDAFPSSPATTAYVPPLTMGLSRTETDKALTQAGLCGFSNPSYLCYLNSVLQCVLRCTFFTRPVLLAGQRSASVSSRYPGKLTRALGLLLNHLHDETYQDVRNGAAYPFAKSLYHRICRVSALFELDEQQDAQELLLALLNGVADEYDGAAAAAAADNKDTKNKKKDRAMPRISFEGMMQTTVQCAKCKHSVPREEMFMAISVPVRATLESSLRQVFRPAPLAGKNLYACESCFQRLPVEEQQLHNENARLMAAERKRLIADGRRDKARRQEEDLLRLKSANCLYREAEVRTSITRLGGTLAVHLLRFHYDSEAQDFVKIATPVAIPLEIDLSSLVSKEVLASYGGAGGGMNGSNGHPPLAASLREEGSGGGGGASNNASVRSSCGSTTVPAAVTPLSSSPPPTTPSPSVAAGKSAKLLGGSKPKAKTAGTTPRGEPSQPPQQPLPPRSSPRSLSGLARPVRTTTRSLPPPAPTGSDATAEDRAALDTATDTGSDESPNGDSIRPHGNSSSTNKESSGSSHGPSNGNAPRGDRRNPRKSTAAAFSATAPIVTSAAPTVGSRCGSQHHHHQRHPSSDEGSVAHSAVEGSTSTWRGSPPAAAAVLIAVEAPATAASASAATSPTTRSTREKQAQPQPPQSRPTRPPPVVTTTAPPSEVKPRGGGGARLATPAAATTTATATAVPTATTPRTAPTPPRPPPTTTAAVTGEAPTASTPSPTVPEKQWAASRALTLTREDFDPFGARALPPATGPATAMATAAASSLARVDGPTTTGDTALSGGLPITRGGDSSGGRQPRLRRQLVGVVTHRGSLHGGHYIAYARHLAQPNVWFRCDDEDVDVVPVKAVLDCAAEVYVAFYE